MRLLLICLMSFCTLLHAKTVKYELTATMKNINVSGKKEVNFALLLNDQLPAPTLEFTEGDDAEITLINQIPNDELSVHWHGLLLDPFMDGVPYVNTPPIRPGEKFTFKFRLRQSGTYWYHSHTGVQEQKGLYGAFIIHPREKSIPVDKDVVLVLSDWTDENPDQVLRNLRKDGDYYTFKKGTMRSWLGAIRAGGLKSMLSNEWSRMGGMDFSDVGYDAFLINGKISSQALMAHPGEKIRLRVINASASTYFFLSLAGLPMKVIAADGTDLKPVMAKEILIGMAETYDILFQVPDHKNYEFKATAQDGTGSASAWIGMGEKVSAPIRPRPDLYASMNMGSMDHSSMGSMDHSQMGNEEMEKKPKMDHSQMNMGQMEKKPKEMDHSKVDMGSMDHSQMGHGSMDNKADKTKLNQTPTVEGDADPETSSGTVDVLTVNDLEALKPTDFPEKIPRYNVTLNLDGDMSRYVWLINGKAIHQDRNLYINKGDIVRFTFVNNTMMHHPMHLHGHFFRVVNKFEKTSPMKHTVDMSPHTTRTIEFLADEPGEWMLHCHNLYHLKTGMGRVVTYSSFKRNPVMEQYQKLDPHLHDHNYFRGMVEGATNHAQAEMYWLKTWDEVELRAETRRDDGWDVEGDLFYKRWLSRFTHLIAGGTLVDQESAVVAGVGYQLPMLLQSHVVIDQNARLRLNLEKRFQWTKYIYTDTEFTFRQRQTSEFEISLMYQRQWNWSAGLMFTEKKFGAGFQYQF